MKSTNQLYFVEKQEKDFDNECGNGETSFASHRSEMRDQGIQSGNGNIRQIVPKRKVKSNPSTKIKQSDHYKYVSPFIQSAELKAKQRAEQYLTAKRREKQRNDWNSNIAPTGSLFDPTIHKQEIFKLQPRNRSSTENIQNVVHRNFANSQGHEDASAALTVNQLNNGRARMTMRSSGEVLPTRRKTAFDNIPSHRTSSGTSPMHSRDGSLGFVSQTNNHHNNMRRSTDEAAESAPTSSHAVTRSTSPISEHVVSSILQEDGLVNDDDFTIHIKSIQGGILDPNQPFESNPKDQEYYTKYLRQRLRDILLDRNDASSDSSGEDRDVEVTDYEELNTSEERGRLRGRGSRRNYGGGSRTSNNYAERKYLRSKEDYSHSRCNSRRSSRSRGGGSRSRSASCSRGGGGATEELMQSMAQIMTAVGSIVTKKQRNPYKSVLRKHARRQRQQEQQYGRQQQEQGHYRNEYNTGHSYAGGNVVLQQPPGQSSSAYSRYSTSANPSIASPALSGLVALGGPLSRASSRQDAHAAAVGMVGVPRTRAEMIDAIMAKLQEIELNELQIKEYLAQSSNRPSEMYVQDLDLHVTSDAAHRHLNSPHSAYELPVSQSVSINVPVIAPVTRRRAEDEQSQSSVAVEAAVSEDERDGTDKEEDKENCEGTVHPAAEGPPTHTTDHISRGTAGTSSTSKGSSSRRCDSSTQDSQHTLQLLHKQVTLNQQAEARGPSVAALQDRTQRMHAQSKGLSAEQLRQKEVAHLKNLPKIPQDYQSNQTILSYMKELDFCREMKDVAFRSRGVSMAQVADRMTDEICARLVSSVANELDEYINDYSEKFLDKI